VRSRGLYIFGIGDLPHSLLNLCYCVIIHLGVTFDFGSALDLVHEILSGWPELFVKHQIFRSLFQHTLCAALLPLLRSLPVDYVEAYKYQLLTSAGGGGDALGGSSNGGGSDTSPSSYVAGRDGSPAATVTKIARIARCILLQYPHGGEFLSTADSVASVMLQALQPDRENDLLLKTLPGNILDGTVTGGGTLLVDGMYSFVVILRAFWIVVFLLFTHLSLLMSS
jgi:hypothetical protein